MADQDPQALIESVLQQITDAKERGETKVRIDKASLPPEVYKAVVDIMKPGLIQKGTNLLTGKLSRVPGWGEYSSNMATDPAKWSAMALPDPTAFSKLTPEQKAQVQAYNSFNAARDDEGKLDLLKIFDPEAAASADVDPFGNRYVQKGGKKLYLNKPGVSTQDIKELGMQTVGTPEAVASLAPTMRAGKAGVSLLEKIAIGAGYGGLTSLAIDKKAIQGGSQQGYDMNAAVANALAGGGAEMLAPLVSKIGKPLFDIFKSGRFISPTGNLSPTGVKLMAKVGIDWTSLSAETQGRVRAMVDKAVDPEDLVRRMAGQDLPGGPVRLSKGQTDQDIGQYADEDLLRSGAFGDSPAQKMKEFDTRQAGDIRANQSAISEVLNPGGARQTNLGEGGKTIAQKLQEAKLANKAAVDASYKGARDLGKDAYFPSIDNIHKDILNDPTVSPILNPSLLENKPFAQAWKEVETAFGPNLRGDSVSVQKAFELLPKLNSIIKNDPVNSFSARELKRKIQKGLADDALVKSIVGDPAGVEAFLKSSNMYKEYANTYKAGDIVEELTEQAYDPATGKMKFTVDPVDGSKIIMGASNLGFINKTGMKNAMETLKSKLPPEAWNSLREEVFLRAMGWSEKDFTEGALVSSAAKFKNSLKDMKTKSPELYSTLFSKEERATLDKFNDVYGKATLSPPTKSTMGSRTTPLMMRAAQQILPVLGPKLKGVMSVIAKPLGITTYKAGMGAAKASNAVGGDLMGKAVDLLQKTPGLAGFAAPTLAAPLAKSVQGLLSRYSGDE